MKASHILSIVIASLLMLSANYIQHKQKVDTSTLEGKVIDHETGEPIPFATVAIYQDNILITVDETDMDGNYVFSDIEAGIYDVEARYTGYQTKKTKGVVLKPNAVTTVTLSISEDGGALLDEILLVEYKTPLTKRNNTSSRTKITNEQKNSLPTTNINGLVATAAGITQSNDGISFRGSRSNETAYLIDGIRTFGTVSDSQYPEQLTGNESYKEIIENLFIKPQEEALSTFSIDVDRAAYSNVRRFINNGSTPPIDAVRIEEMVNYFNYDYEGPKGKKETFAVHQELTECPWNDGHKLLHIGIQGQRINTKDLPPSNLVFLIDASGSMHAQNKLPLLKQSFKLLINELRPEDKVAIVTYAGNADIVLMPTSASNKTTILNAMEALTAGGGTGGAQGIITAYQLAEDSFAVNGNNRVILATDGDFNIGASSDNAMEKLIEEKRKSGIFLSVLGFGMGNYKDSKMQVLAQKGNGNHAYIDNLMEAKKTLVTEFGGTLHTIAKDVKIQVEFNPKTVASYKLVGYENRMLAKEDFNDDTKDAGELGAGHTVTAIYEIVPTGTTSPLEKSVDPLKYQPTKKVEKYNSYKNELATIKLRWKKPQGKKSTKLEVPVKTYAKELSKCSASTQFATAVAEFGLILRGSKMASNPSLENVLTAAALGRGKDQDGYKAEFIRLVETYQGLVVTD